MPPQTSESERSASESGDSSSPSKLNSPTGDKKEVISDKLLHPDEPLMVEPQADDKNDDELTEDECVSCESEP
ncbi:hypothetical protein GcC1_008005 [Golovinomyces cichoracearum]|uniref:Uncharacterized protein n=1 Tax=Golovinomyces cichoracearum TaxID=62708 RepID=A0A420J873_9PEZI|nr:hypothetical protein GcC1_008005 [Golovinomyces cichoracearum]